MAFARVAWAAINERDAGYPAGLTEFAEAAGSGDERLPHRDRRHQHVGGIPATLLGDLVGQGLLPLVFVRVAGGAGVEEETIVDQPIPVADEVIVDAGVENEIGSGGGHVEQLWG